MELVSLPNTSFHQCHIGICAEALPYCLSQMLISKNSLQIIICPSNAEAETLFAQLSSLPLLEKYQLLHFPPTVDSTSLSSLKSNENDRLGVLNQLTQERVRSIIVTACETIFSDLPNRKALESDRLRVKVDQEFPFEKCKSYLAETLLYHHEMVCEEPGQFAIRGGLIDVYPYQAHQPYRIDFFGDTIDSIHTYDPTTQRSLEEKEAIDILPIKISEGLTGFYFGQYLPSQSLSFYFVEPKKMKSSFPERFSWAPQLDILEPNYGCFLQSRSKFQDSWISIQSINQDSTLFKEIPKTHWETSDFSSESSLSSSLLGIERTEKQQQYQNQFLRKVSTWESEGQAVIIQLNLAGDRKRFEEQIQKLPAAEQFIPRYKKGLLRKGFTIRQGDKTLYYLTDAELFGRSRKGTLLPTSKKLPQYSKVDQLLDFSELVEGDYLVHQQHGICRFGGLTHLKLSDKNIEVITLEFEGSMSLHLPLNESHLLSRYVGLSKSKPKLAKIGGATWSKNRAAAEAASMEFAAELIRLQAARSVSPGFAHLPDTPWQQSFEDAFPFEETPDQKRAISETKADMEQTEPMDRLICGDVGFGKTEVAIRAAFKAVMSGKQVALLAPTTVLTQQHLQTFQDRLTEYPITVEMVSRFRTKSQQKQIIDQTKGGKIDILIGTHRLISEDIGFKDLGLLIIDEEQRFGVKHKEKIKGLKTHIDILTLSATPIPRTLYASIVGLRKLSVIETPPQQRLPIETHITEYHPETIKSALNFELQRGGQAFYLHNRVQTIYQVAATLEDLVPGLRVVVGHGQMDEKTLEKAMTDFVARQYDLMVCTTIIESGLDIPNCNTILIESAHRFGLAQLYQLRGRVGRFNRQAHAYLLLSGRSNLDETAEKRLLSLKQNRQLGAGYRIALHDLELRGSGNLLGEKQSGHIANVGFDLYCKLLQQSIAQLKGKTEFTFRSSLKIDFIRNGDPLADDEQMTGTQVRYAYLPNTYISEAQLRIDFYRKLAMANELSEVEGIEQELKDRFGKVPEPAQDLCKLTQLRVLCQEKGFRELLVETSIVKATWARPSEQQGTYWMIGNRFPRLTKKKPKEQLKELLKKIAQLQPFQK